MSLLQDKAFVAAFAISVVLTLVLFAGQPDIFIWLFGPIHPFAVVGGAGVVGWVGLAQFETGTTPPNWPRLALLGLVFVAPPVLIDLALPFPKDINVPFPLALGFYPVAGFVAEVVFHILPLAVMALILQRRDLPVWAFAPAAFAEPVFQVVMSASFDLQGALVFLHVLVFSSVQLWALRKYGFAAMFGLRMFFYLGWHLAWGWLRLGLLFQP